MLFLKGLAGLIRERDDMQVVGEATDGFQAIELARTTTPDVVLLDIHMPRCTGLQAIEPILRDVPGAHVVMLTVSEEDEDLFTAIKCGAFGYLLKDLEPQQLFEFLEGIGRGEAPVAGVMAARILNEFRQNMNRRVATEGATDALTERELEVLKRVASGETNREIAATLCVTESTVKVHMRSILEKLHVQNRIQATAYAIRHGLADTSSFTSN